MVERTLDESLEDESRCWVCGGPPHDTIRDCRRYQQEQVDNMGPLCECGHVPAVHKDRLGSCSITECLCERYSPPAEGARCGLCHQPLAVMPSRNGVHDRCASQASAEG